MTTSKPSKNKIPLLLAFGAVVRQRRKSLGYSQEAFGDACGIDRSYMGRIERGEHNPTLISIMKIVETLGLQPSEFFRELDKPKK
ncbi:helix-turn-helix domain-containing protein [Alcaligenes sp. DN25]|uniref:helix-turn-helix domain-containing protein n=1 Tax=Alcaligenes TaxID=507 RepID=UPI00202DD326|nr:MULTISPECIES: helix-turn-helix transcriptional regulator [Alcaligenes]URW82159.1 helix-turn-helix domain-containing protein [Alcaligenes sp. DN25]WEA66980.1 helix-turn-helix transcriptional regulator [Alcaligenes faecalis]